MGLRASRRLRSAADQFPQIIIGVLQEELKSLEFLCRERCQRALKKSLKYDVQLEQATPAMPTNPVEFSHRGFAARSDGAID